MLEQIDLQPGLRVAILGDGRMGLLAAQVVRTRTPRVVVIGAHDAKLAVARRLGIETVSAEESRDVKAVFDVVVDATGRPAGLPRAIELVRPRGTIVLKSTFHGAVPIASWPIVVDEVTLVGSRCGPFRTALDLLATREVQVAPLVSRIARLEEHESAFADARRMLKVLLAPAA
jgi:alcohol dehydrogenase